MPSQLVRTTGNTAPRKVGWRREGTDALPCELAGDQAGVCQVADPDRHVDALFDQIGEPVTQTQIDRYLRVPLTKPRQRRREEVDSDGQRSRDFQRASGLGPGCDNGLLDPLGLVQQLQGLLVKVASLWR